MGGFFQCFAETGSYEAYYSPRARTYVYVWGLYACMCTPRIINNQNSFMPPHVQINLQGYFTVREILRIIHRRYLIAPASEYRIGDHCFFEGLTFDDRLIETKMS